MATPIGNAADITLRALAALRTADVVACEDTRVTAKLLALHGIKAPLTPYHDHNAERVRPRLIERLKHGQTVALVSDAGTPLISDPGYRLVRACREAGIPVRPLPGASSVLAALAVAGLPTDRFLFAGFLPNKAEARRSAIRTLAAIPATLVVMESARRLPEALADLAAGLGPREAAVCRELTKLYEEVRTAPLDTLAAAYSAEGPPKGEVVLVIAPPAPAVQPGEADLDAALVRAFAGRSLRDAVEAAAAETGIARRAVYARALVLKRDKP